MQGVYLLVSEIKRTSIKAYKLQSLSCSKLVVDVPTPPQSFGVFSPIILLKKSRLPLDFFYLLIFFIFFIY